MAGTALADPIARALVGVAAFCGPVTYTADALHEGELLHPVFRVGATAVASMVGMRPITYDLGTVGYWLAQDANHQLLLRHALEDRVAAGEALLEGWAERIRPPPQELLPAPSDPYREARGSSSATSTSLPHTLEHRGYTGTEEECSKTESRPPLDTVDCAPDCVIADGEPLAPLPAAGGDVLRDLAAAQVVTLAELSAAGVILLFVANFLRPLVFAHVNGLQVLGAELPLPTSRRPDAALRLCLPHADG